MSIRLTAYRQTAYRRIIAVTHIESEYIGTVLPPHRPTSRPASDDPTTDPTPGQPTTSYTTSRPTGRSWAVRRQSGKKIAPPLGEEGGAIAI